MKRGLASSKAEAVEAAASDRMICELTGKCIFCGKEALQMENSKIKMQTIQKKLPTSLSSYNSGPSPPASASGLKARYKKCRIQYIFEEISNDEKISGWSKFWAVLKRRSQKLGIVVNFGMLCNPKEITKYLVAENGKSLLAICLL